MKNSEIPENIHPSDFLESSKQDTDSVIAATSAMSFIVSNADKTKFSSKRIGKPESIKRVHPSRADAQIEITRRRIEKIDLTPKDFHLYSKAKSGPGGT